MINLNSPIQTHKYMHSALFIENKTPENVRKRTAIRSIVLSKVLKSLRENHIPLAVAGLRIESPEQNQQTHQ